jgi:hypothetical protein
VDYPNNEHSNLGMRKEFFELPNNCGCSDEDAADWSCVLIVNSTFKGES